MAVTLTTQMLLQPLGELSEYYFPQGDAVAQLDGWLPVAIAKVEADSYIDSAEHDRAAAAYVYYRAYDYIANQLAALPSSASEGSGAIDVKYAAAQYAFFQAKAARKLAEFEAVRVAVASGPWLFTLAHGQRGR